MNNILFYTKENLFHDINKRNKSFPREIVFLHSHQLSFAYVKTVIVPKQKNDISK